VYDVGIDIDRMLSEVVLVRHATPFVPERGGPDDYHRSLTDGGFEQAVRLTAELVAMRPVAVLSSPYLRAVQTVEPTARALGMAVRTRQDLREWDSGFEPGPDFVRHHADSWADPQFARPGGESLQQLSHRAITALVSVARKHAGQTVIIGSHGTFISRALIGFGVELDWRPFSRAMPMPAIYRLSVSEQGTQATGPGL
jgi:2,3-bisphosphoglycerate-dependent phosphoglycerate mutase